MTAVIRTALGFLMLGGLLATSLAQAQSYYAGCNCTTPQTRVVTTTRYLPPPVIRTASPPLLLQAIPVRGQSTVVNFAFDRSNLDAGDQARLDAVVTGNSGLAQVENITVVGHTDSIGSRGYNQGLSMRRANTVASYLGSRGIPPNHIAVAGAGESQPVASNRSRRGRAANRRAEVSVDGYALVPPRPIVRYPLYQVSRY